MKLHGDRFEKESLKDFPAILGISLLLLLFALWLPPSILIEKIRRLKGG